MKANIILSLVLASTIVSSAHAEDQTANTSTLQVGDLQKKDEHFRDIDDDITNARMRATLGSKSKWSFKSALGYSGGSIEKPLNGVIPAYRASGSRETLAGLSGTVGINYRLNEKDNLGLNTGISITDPLHGTLTKPAPDKRYGGDSTISRYQVTTPTGSWSRGYKALNTQMISEVDVSYYTDSDSHDISNTGSIALNQTILANFGTSKWQGGLSAMYDQEFYSGGLTAKDPDTIALYESGKGKRTDAVIALYPFAEYSFNDTYSFRTVFGWFEFYHYKNEYGNDTNFVQKEPYQSVGIGISITRDIYLYPNLQFAPKDIRADRTNVALSSNISLF